MHFDFAVFVFYLADDVERFYLIMLYIPMSFFAKKLLEILGLLYKRATTPHDGATLTGIQKKGPVLNYFVASMLVVSIFFKNMQIIYSAFKGTLSLDINLQAGNKTVGE